MDFSGSTGSNVEIGNKLFTAFTRIATQAGREQDHHVGVTTMEELDWNSLHPLV
jgi:hypothetical protein